MFKFSFDWLKAESEIPVNYNDLIKYLNEQGFEIASVEDVKGDKLIDIEVKANRPDMLSVAGVLREYYIHKEKIFPKKFGRDFKFQVSNKTTALSVPISIESKDVKRYFAIEIENVNNAGKTPAYIVDRLTKMGVASINPIVDISNYVLLQVGQPIHIFDRDKLDKKIKITSTAAETKIVTLSGNEAIFPENTIIISDNSSPLCVAGIIGCKKAEVDSKTKNIIIESANFDHIAIRMSSKKSHVSTLASYRFERGVPPYTAPVGAALCAEMILDIAGGELSNSAFDYYPRPEKEQVLDLTVSKTNSILGTTLKAQEISQLLKKCFFKVEKVTADKLKVTVPNFRLDIEFDVDLIEEVGRMYGYHNIVPQPIKLYAPYQENRVNTLSNELRNIIIGHGFIECLNYGFIPSNSMELLRISDKKNMYYGDIQILNPLSNLYSLMRPSLLYGLLTTAINNLALGEDNIEIFEIGRTFYRDKSGEFGFNERNSIGILFCGSKIQKGFGNKESKYNAHDASGLLYDIMGEYNLPIKIKNCDNFSFFDKGIGAEIILHGKTIGCIGKISKDVLANFNNGKLVKDDLLYIEFAFDDIIETTKKTITFESNQPSIVREYNFIVKNGVNYPTYSPIIEKASNIIVSVKPTDVYTGAGVGKGTSSVLISVEYNGRNKTLQAEEIEKVENKFLAELKSKFDIDFKK